MISEIDLQDWVIYPERALDKLHEGDDFLYQGNHCTIKKKGWFTFDVMDMNGLEFELDFYTLVNPLKKKEN